MAVAAAAMETPVVAPEVPIGGSDVVEEATTERAAGVTVETGDHIEETIVLHGQ